MFAGRTSPCQWIDAVSSSVLRTRIVTVSPSRQCSSGAGSDPLTVIAVRSAPVKLTDDSPIVEIELPTTQRLLRRGPRRGRAHAQGDRGPATAPVAATTPPVARPRTKVRRDGCIVSRVGVCVLMTLVSSRASRAGARPQHVYPRADARGHGGLQGAGGDQIRRTGGIVAAGRGTGGAPAERQRVRRTRCGDGRKLPVERGDERSPAAPAQPRRLATLRGPAGGRTGVPSRGPGHLSPPAAVADSSTRAAHRHGMALRVARCRRLRAASPPARETATNAGHVVSAQIIGATGNASVARISANAIPRRPHQDITTSIDT